MFLARLSLGTGSECGEKSGNLSRICSQLQFVRAGVTDPGLPRQDINVCRVNSCAAATICTILKNVEH